LKLPEAKKRGYTRNARENRENIARMRNLPLGWSIAGAVVGILGFAYNLMTLGAIINGAYVGRVWITLGVVLCPWVVPVRNLWCILALNCILYAMLFAGLRIAWLRIHAKTIAN
jgi:hypothetical protein